MKMKNDIPYIVRTKKEIFQEKVNIIHDNKYLVVGEYIKNNTKILMKCNICDHNWDVLPMQLTRSNKPTGCPKCSNNLRKDTDSFKKEVFELVNNAYLVLGEYINNSVPIEINHVACNNTYLVRPNDFQQGYRCPFCSHGHSLKSNDEFKKEVFDLVGNEYLLLSEYTGTGKYIEIQHNIPTCDFKYKVLPRNFLSNKTRCPECKSTMKGDSKGSKQIKEFLEKLAINFELEKTFETCRNIRKLKFDFYIPELKLLLEFDGNQHFRETKFSKGENFINSQKRDMIKNQWCIDNNYSLLRIDEINIRKLNKIWDILFNNERSTTIENYNIFYIENGKILYNNNKYYIE